MNKKKNRGRSGQTVMCCNDGLIFDSLHSAAKNYKISVSAITRQLKNERKTASGFYFVAISGEETREKLDEIRLNAIKAHYKLKEVVLK